MSKAIITLQDTPEGVELKVTFEGGINPGSRAQQQAQVLLASMDAIAEAQGAAKSEMIVTPSNRTVFDKDVEILTGMDRWRKPL